MLIKLLYIIFFINSILYSINLHLIADKVEIKNKIITAKNTLLNWDNSHIKANILRVNSETKNIFFYKIKYFYSNKLWIIAKSGGKIKNNFFFKQGTFSTCNILNPDWKILFTDCSFNENTKQIKFKNI